MLFGYLGVAGALALILFARRLPAAAGVDERAAAALGTGGAVLGAGGWLFSTGLAVAGAEGGDAVRAGLPLPVAHVLGESGGLVAVCGPALFVGVIALVVARSRAVPRWVRASSLVGGLCGVLAPLYVTFWVFALWALVTGTWLALSRAPRDIDARDAVVLAG